METAVKQTLIKILNDFVHNSVLDYIVDGAQDIVASSGVYKLNTKENGNFWEITANVQGEDLQTYNPHLEIHLNDETVNYQCNCSDIFSGACKHVASLALAFLQSLEVTNRATSVPMLQKNEWKQSFRSFYSTTVEAESGQHYLVIRLFPEEDRLLASFFRARQNKSGLSNVHTEITLEQIINTPEWCEHSPELPKVAQQIGQMLDYFGHRVEVPEGLLTWFLWAIKGEYYTLWEETNSLCAIEQSPMRLKLTPRVSDDGLSFDVTLHKGQNTPLTTLDEHATFHGHTPLWVCWNHTFYPVYTSLDAKLVQDLVKQPPLIPQAELSEFLDRVWTNLPSSELYGQESFLEQMEPYFQPATYNPKLFLNEEGSLLTLEVQNVYETLHGEFLLNGPNPDLQTGSYPIDDKTCLIRRHQDQEANLLTTLAEMKFRPRNNKIWFLEPEEAINFLLDSYPKLIEQYRVYGEKALSRYKVRLTQPIITAKVESNEADKWFSLDINVDYEGQSVPLEKIWQAWVEGKRYVQLKDGSYTSLPESWLKKIAHKLQALGIDASAPPQKEFKQFEAPILDSLLDDLPNAQTDSFWNNLRGKIRSFEEIVQVEQPKGLHGDLRGYQLQGLSYLHFLQEYGFGGILADEMGLGKTIQTLSFIQYMVEKGSVGANLIVVPTSVLPNWDREAEKFVPNLRRLVIYGTRRENLFSKINDSDIVITTYALLRRDLEELQKFEFNSVILDEAQNIKNPGTITAKSVRNINTRIRLCLSGTPIENNLFELWSLFEFLMPGFLGSQHAFQRGVVKPIKEGDSETLEYLRTRVRPFILRRTKSEVAKDLPPKIENIYYCALEEEQAELYMAIARKLKEQVLADVDQNGLAKSQMSILDALLKLRQICCHPRLLKLEMPGFSTNLASGKFDAFKDMITDIVDEGHKVLVFSQFVQMLHIIRSWLQISAIPHCYLDGTTKDRFEQVDRFNNNKDIPIFLISLKAGGTGINLTAADYVIHYDPWWNPAVENQATDRAHRIGQTKQVFSYKLICQNTVEERILKLQDRKRSVAESIIPGQETWKSLTREDLEMLFEI